MRTANQHFLDPIPIVGILILFALAMAIAYEVGFRLGLWHQIRTTEEEEKPTAVFVGSLLGLMAFLLGITMSMASDRFDRRRGLVLSESNAIWTAYLRAGYLPSPYNEQIRDILRAYVPLRIAPDSAEAFTANLMKSSEAHEELWAIVEDVVATQQRDDILALFVESINGVLESHEERVQGSVYSRVPDLILVLLLGGSVLTLGMVGYSNGLARKRGIFTAAVLIVALSTVTVLVIDLDRPRDGFIHTSQQALIDLQARIGPPSS